MAKDAGDQQVATQQPDDNSFRSQFTKMESEFQAALPPHMPVDRFMRVVLTAVNGNPELLKADRRSLFEAAMKAAQDGLLPDGRDGALVIYNTKLPKRNRNDANERDTWIQKVQWMPMIAGILKRVRNSGELKTIVARVVYGGDHYRCWVDDEGEHVEYEATEDHDTSIVRRIFAMAKLKDDSVEVEELFPADVEKIRNASKSKDRGPWVDWWAEMAKKSALRRLSKRLPISADLDDLIRRDDELYDFQNKSGELPPAFDRVKNPLQDQPAQIENNPSVPMENLGAGREAEVVERDDESDAGAPQEQRRDDPISSGLPPKQADAQKQQPAQGAGKPAEKGSDAEVRQPAESRASAQGGTAARPAYEMTAESYMTYMRDEFDRASSTSSVNELWGSTRSDRQELLQGTALLDELTSDKTATLQRIKLKKGAA